MRRYLFLVFLALCCAACTRRRSASETSLPADKKPFTIYLQPYEDFPQREAEALRASITQALGRVYRGDWSHVEVLPSRPQPPHAYYKPRQRYLASALLCDLTVAGPDAFVIGLTHKDISFNIHNTKNYGILYPADILRDKVTSKGLWFWPTTPQIDEDGIADFSAMEKEGLIQVLSQRKWDERQYLWPIPTSEIIINENMKQNPGY